MILAATGVGAQSPPDFFQYPALTRSTVFQRWWWAFSQRAYPLGDVPAGAKLRALQAIRRTAPASAVFATAVPGDSWTNIGPAPTQAGQIGATGGTRDMSGRITAIAVDPGDASHWLVGAAQGGIWSTTDAGVTWIPLTDGEASLAMGAIAFAPSNTSVIYAGTGEQNFSLDSYGGAGLLKSTDGGATWSLRATSTFAKTSFSAIRVDPANANTLVASTTIGFAGRSGDFLSSPPARGIFRSTDGGVTWSRPLTGEGTALIVDPANFQNQYAGLGNIIADAANGVYRSIDRGQTWSPISGPWTALTGGLGRVAVAIAPSNSNTVYVGIQDVFTNPAGAHDGGLLGLFRTDNAWAATPTWIQISATATDDGTGFHGYCGWDPAFSPPASDQCWYNNELIVDPLDAGTLYAGGIGLWRCASCSTTPTWTEVSQTVSSPATGIHVDQHALAFAGTRLIAGNDGGVWSSTDGGMTWSDHNTGLSISQFYDGSIHPTNASIALGGSQDNGTEKWTGTDSWAFVFGGDGAANAISSAAPDTNWAVSFQFLSISRTKDGGANFFAADGGIDPNRVGAPFISRFETCPANDDIFIAGTDNVWRSNNFFSGVSASWTDNGSGNFTGGITALAFAPQDGSCNTYAFGSSLGSLRITTTGGSVWTNLDPDAVVPDRAVTDLAFDPTNSDILYVTLSGFDEGTLSQPGHVFKTTNARAGSNIVWTNVSPPVNIPHNTIAVDPGDPNTVYVGTDLGIWRSTNGGLNWGHMGPAEGMPNVAVFDLKINSATHRVVAFTHGRGAFALHGISVTNGPGGMPNPVASGGTVSVSVAAADSLGHALTYAWSASCPALGSNGTFSDPAAQNPTWTAPANVTGSQQGCTISVTASDGPGVSAQAGYTQSVSPIHTLTITTPAGGMPNPVASGGTVSVSVAAADSLGHALTYAWSASCPALGSNGSFSNPAAQNPTWTAPVNATGSSQTCMLVVLVGDGHGLTASSSYGQAVAASAIPVLSLQLNQTVFHPGGTMVLTVTLVPGLTSPLVDAYIVVQLPDGTFFSLRPVGAVPGIAPIATGFTPVAVSGVLLSYRFTGAEPPGTYSWFAALTQSGTGTLIGPFQQLPFTVAP